MCVWANHKIFNQVKCENSYGCEKRFPDHTCLFDTDAEWIDGFYDVGCWTDINLSRT